MMPFGLKNVGATFQRMVTKIFKPILGNTMDAYIDDMMVKSKEEPDHIRDLTEVFTILTQIKIKHDKMCLWGELEEGFGTLGD